MAGQAGRAFEQAVDSEKITFYYEHVLWVVGERPARASDIQRTPHLVFECDACIRRVRRFPENWRDLTSTDLYELSWRT